MTLAVPGVAARRFIVLVCLVQGLLLWWAQAAAKGGWPPLEAAGRIMWWTLTLTVPTLAAFSVVSLRDLRFWQHVLGTLLLFAALAAWAGWSVTSPLQTRASAVLERFGATLALACFIGLPWLQVRLDAGRWSARYDALFGYAWQNALVGLLAAVFTGLCWMVLRLCAALFELVDIHFFRALFESQLFSYPATGVMAGLGIVIGRSQPGMVRIARQILLGVFKGLLPMLAAIALMFLLALCFTGLEPLWHTRYAAAALACLVALTILLTNAVYQDGGSPRPYPAALRRLVHAALLALPIFAAIALHALGLRIGQYGWTQERLWGALALGVLMLYALGHAVGAVRRGEHWLPGAARVNAVLSLLIVALIAAANSPLLDPHRITVASQLTRLGEEDFDFDHLRFDSGRRGVEALQSLRADARVAADPELAKKLDATLARQLPEWERPATSPASPAPTADDLASRLFVPTGTPAPPRELLEAFAADESTRTECRPGDECVVIAPDLDADGRHEYVLCRVRTDAWLQCTYWRKTDAWRRAGHLNPLEPLDNATIDAVRAGRFGTARPALHDLILGETRFRPTSG